MFGFAMVFVEAGPTALRVLYLLVRKRPFGWSAWVGVALVPMELAGTVFVGGTVFVLAHLVFATVFGGAWLAGRTPFGRTAFLERTLFVGRALFVERPVFVERAAERTPRNLDGSPGGRRPDFRHVTSAADRP